MIESPLAGDTKRNIQYAKDCMKDSLARGEAPFAMHLLYAQEDVLDDLKPEERALGIKAGLEWAKRADLIAFYIDYGISNGMKMAQDNAIIFSLPTTHRKLYA